MPAAQRLFFLPELLLPAISVSLEKSLNLSAVREDGVWKRGYAPLIRGKTPSHTTNALELTAVGGMSSSRPQPGWLARSIFVVYFSRLWFRGRSG
jgi:hypothetical protein